MTLGAASLLPWTGLCAWDRSSGPHGVPEQHISASTGDPRLLDLEPSRHPTLSTQAPHGSVSGAENALCAPSAGGCYGLTAPHLPACAQEFVPRQGWAPV